MDTEREKLRKAVEQTEQDIAEHLAGNEDTLAADFLRGARDELMMNEDFEPSDIAHVMTWAADVLDRVLTPEPQRSREEYKKLVGEFENAVRAHHETPHGASPYGLANAYLTKRDALLAALTGDGE